MRKIDFIINLLGLPSNLVFIGGYLILISESIKLFFINLGENMYLTIAASVLFLLLLLWLRNFILIKYILRNRINSFYENITKREFNSSWKMLNEEIKKDRWDNDETRFINGFKYNVGIDIIGIYFDKYFDNTFNYIVFYKDSVQSPVIKGLKEIQEKKICEINDVAEFINKLQEDFYTQKLDVDVFNTLKLRDIFNSNFSDTLRWIFKVDILQNVESKTSVDTFINARIIGLKRKSFFSKLKICNVSNIADYPSLKN